MSKLAIIVAVAENGVIGRDNGLPWRLSGDLQYFKRVTMGKPVIMGRKTYESIGRPLPGRRNIVITRNPSFQADGIDVVPSLDAALALAGSAAAAEGVEETVVIGGAEIYRAALPLADRLYITEVHASVEGDTLLPEIDWDQWRESSREVHAADPESADLDYSFVRYERAGPTKGQ
jgi:dihydrofolate reductase